MNLLRGYGYAPHLVSGDDPAVVHRALAAALGTCVKQIVEIHRRARSGGDESRPEWPMIILRTPRGGRGCMPGRAARALAGAGG
jgi:xylulose-5-phosphate/fructose-6-phosphate phosphoketolase